MRTQAEKIWRSPQSQWIFFKTVNPSIIIKDEILYNSVLYVENQIDHVPNKKIGNPRADILALRSLVKHNLSHFQDFCFASAYISLLYKMAQCGEFSDILFSLLGEHLPYGTIIEKFAATWSHDNHAYIKVKLPRGYEWPDGSRVKFCDAWYKKNTENEPGVYNALEMNKVLRIIGKGNKPLNIKSEVSKVLQAPICTQCTFGIQ